MFPALPSLRKRVMRNPGKPEYFYLFLLSAVCLSSFLLVIVLQELNTYSLAQKQVLITSSQEERSRPVNCNVMETFSVASTSVGTTIENYKDDDSEENVGIDQEAAEENVTEKEDPQKAILVYQNRVYFIKNNTLFLDSYIHAIGINFSRRTFQQS